MTLADYGVRLKNVYGEDVVDFNAMMYVAETGLCRRSDQLIGSYVPGHEVYSGGIAAPFHNNGIAGQYQTPCTHVVNNLLFPFLDPSSLFFYRLTNEGLHRVNDNLVDQAGYAPGMISELLMPSSVQGNLPYKRISSLLPDTTPPEAHGMRMFDANGNLCFDSRFPAYGVLDHLIVSQADMQAVLINGEVRTYTLRQPVAAPFVHAPLFTSFREFCTTNGQRRFIVLPRLYQIDAFTLGLEATTYRGTESRFTYSVSWFQDTVLLIGS